MILYRNLMTKNWCNLSTCDTRNLRRLGCPSLEPPSILCPASSKTSLGPVKPGGKEALDSERLRCYLKPRGLGPLSIRLGTMRFFLVLGGWKGKVCAQESGSCSPIDFWEHMWWYFLALENHGQGSRGPRHDDIWRCWCIVKHSESYPYHPWDWYIYLHEWLFFNGKIW